MKIVNNRASANSAGLFGLIIALMGFTGATQAEPIGIGASPSDFDTQSLLSPQPQQSAQEELQPDSVIARVDGQDVLFGELQQRLQGVLSSVPENVPVEMIQQQLPQLMSESLNNIIVEKLVRAKVEEENVTVDSDEINERISEIESQLPEGTMLSQVLLNQNMTMARFREQLREQLKLEKVLSSHVEQDFDATDVQVREFYDENVQEFFQEQESVSARHILIGFEDDDGEDEKDAKLEKIEGLRKSIVDDEMDFAEVAEDHSSCPSSANGGSLGSFGRGQMVPSFENVAFEQPIGEVSEPVETDFGYHLILVEDRTQGRTVPFEEVEDRIRAFLIQQQQQQANQQFVQKLSEEADIEILVDLNQIGLDITN